MAGPAPDFQLPNSSFFNIYSDAPPIAAASSPNLPGGPCNFTDLTHGANGPRCGCRRFWSRAAPRTERGSPTVFPSSYPNGFPYGGIATPSLEEQSAWCMCNHHACFHDDTRDSQTSTPVPGLPNLPVATTFTNTNGQENERPRSGREPLTPVLPELSFTMPPTGQSMNSHPHDNAVTSNPHIPESGYEQREDVAAPTRAPSVPDTLSWSAFLQSDPDPGAMLPPIPSQCLLPSQPSSTTSSTRRGYLKPFSGKGLQTLSGVRSNMRDPLFEKDHGAQPEDEDPVDHEIDPSVDDGRTITNTPRSSRHTDVSERPNLPPSAPVSRGAFQLLSNTVHGHEQRIDSLENISFSAAAHDQCHEKHDQADLRVTELETRVEEVEKILNDTSSNASVYHRSRRAGGDDGASTVVSISTNGGSQLDRAELYEQLQTLRAQLSHLQGLTSFPCTARPWEVEVVFLPFPLKNVWLEPRNFGSQRLPGAGSIEADPWTQLPSSASIMDPQSPGYNEWTGPEAESDWLLARACAPDQMIGQRLRSRGLVKNVMVHGPDARSVQQAINEAFGTLFRTFSRLQANVHHGSTLHHRVTKFLGLQSPWVPLRKVHKDSRLRFLAPAEMVTPVSWDVQFLSSSVVMKSNGVQRLFITHPEAYLQDEDAYDNGWNWQRLRELSRVYADSQSSQEVPEGDAKEECWSWNAVLDDQPAVVAAATVPRAGSSQYSNLPQPHPPRRRWTSRSPSQAAGAFVHPSSSHRSVMRATSPAMLRDRRTTSRPPSASLPPPLLVRTASMPPPVVTASSPIPISASKRRMMAHAQQHYERRSSPAPMARVPASGIPGPPMTAGIKRARGTRSPSVGIGPRGSRSRYTPRYSTASPSPAPEAFGIPTNASVSGLRAGTPFYATPHSNAPFVDTRPGHGNGVVYFDDEGDVEVEDLYDSDNADLLSAEFSEDDGDDAGGDSPMHDRPEHYPQHNDGTPFGPGSQSQPHNQGPWQDAGAPRNGLSGPVAPEDEAWQGLEDRENHSQDLGDVDLGIDIHVDDDAAMTSDFDDEDEEEDENATIDADDVDRQRVMQQDDDDNDDDDDNQSDASSVPSEYPSTQRAWTGGAGAGGSGAVDASFGVFEDGTREEMRRRLSGGGR
ncbi:hypothetical protein F4780DRAFT_448163 [Xylariomycetidae sp. FL0641]|nr:hypothetical protein F4780DRAFT_448163 [Xylariomycetidae sp. FL0641]